VTAGVGVVAIGIILVALVWSNWSYIAEAAKSVSTAAAGLVASSGVAVLGLILVYAGLGKTGTGSRSL